MEVFLTNKNQVYNYSNLLIDINNSEYYYKAFKTQELYDFFLNLIVALLSNKNLILIDADLNLSELKNSSIGNDLNVKETIIPLQFDSFEQLKNQIQKSTSVVSVFTSGTTGQPKIINHSISTLTRAVRKSENHKGQIWGFAYNPTHMAGLQVFFQAFENDNTIINIFNNSRTAIFNAIEKYNITNISATPTFFRLLLPFEKEYPSVTRITLGGEKSSEKLYRSIINLFPNAKINNIYASTEAGSVLAAKGENFHIPKNEKNKFQIKNNELFIHKSLLGKFEDNYLHEDYYNTGDLVEWVDELEGLFRFKSRNNELLNVGGYKVNPSEVEEVLLELPQIQHVVVYGKPNSILGHVICAEIKLIKANTLLESDIRIYLSQKLQDFKIPRKITFVESIKLTRTGKVKR